MILRDETPLKMFILVMCVLLTTFSTVFPQGTRPGGGGSGVGTGGSGGGSGGGHRQEQPLYNPKAKVKGFGVKVSADKAADKEKTARQTRGRA